MNPRFLDTFRVLTSFAPARTNLADAPWEDFTDWAVSQGLAPLAAYNLEYRLGGAGAPEWVRDRLMSIYQGSLNDNVMKLVNFKRTVDSLEGRTVVLQGAVCFAESLYPHVAFRPVVEIDVLVPLRDLDPFSNFMSRADFKPDADTLKHPSMRQLSDGRTLVTVRGAISGNAEEDKALLKRAIRHKVYGASIYRLDLEDAIVVQVAQMARAGFDVPTLEWLDLRELLLGAPSMGDVYSRALDVPVLKARAHAWGLDRALYGAVGVLEALFPETAGPAAAVRPDLSWPVREVLDRLLIAPLSQVGRTQSFKGEDALLKLLASGPG